MHIADLLSQRSDHYVSSGDDNKDQVLLNPVFINFVRLKGKLNLDKSQKDSVLLCKRRLYSTNLDKSQKDYSRSVSY